MPCYKGGKFIENSIHAVENEVGKFCDNFEIIVVVDGYVDNSYEIAKKLERKYENLKVVGYEKNRGKGYAIKYGLENSNGDYISLLDSDLDYHPSSLEYFLKLIKEKNYDIVIGNRRDIKSINHYSPLRKFLSFCFNLYVNTLFPKLKLRDTQAGIKLFRRECLEKLLENLNIYSYAFDIALLVVAREKNFKIAEAPCIFKHKHTKIEGLKILKVIYKMGKDVLLLRLKV